MHALAGRAAGWVQCLSLHVAHQVYAELLCCLVRLIMLLIPGRRQKSGRTSRATAGRGRCHDVCFVCVLVLCLFNCLNVFALLIYLFVCYSLLLCLFVVG